MRLLACLVVVCLFVYFVIGLVVDRLCLFMSCACCSGCLGCCVVVLLGVGLSFLFDCMRFRAMSLRALFLLVLAVFWCACFVVLMLFVCACLVVV